MGSRANTNTPTTPQAHAATKTDRSLIDCEIILSMSKQDTKN
jgi:hypothetical protein